MIIQIENIFRELASKHQMINHFAYTDSYSIQKDGDTPYTALLLENDYNISLNLANKNINITFYVLDIPKEGNEDLLFLQDKTESILESLILKLEMSYKDIIQKVVSTNYISLFEWNGDKTIGWRCEMSLDINRTKNNCLEPYFVAPTAPIIPPYEPPVILSFYEDSGLLYWTTQNGTYGQIDKYGEMPLPDGSYPIGRDTAPWVFTLTDGITTVSQTIE